MSIVSNPILAAKFRPPFLRSNRVARTNLVEKIEQGYQAGARLTLICAPAGYGKTTLALEWLQGQPALAWFSLDEGDNDPARFFTSLVTALRIIDPQLGMRTLSLLSVPKPPPVEHLAGELISELGVLTRPVVLALDDYHHIHQPAIHDALEILLAYPPANLHLLITTRADPAFPLSRLRANGQLTEIRLNDLRFAGEEVRLFLTQVHHLELPQASLEKLARITEGWVAGLQLAGLAIHTEQDAERFFDTFTGAHPYILTYLLDEVLHRQPPAIQHFLTATAILERFNADLCAAVIGSEPDSSQPGEPLDCRLVLAELDRANLFLTPLDPAHTWFRYHRLFSDVLRLGIDPARAAGLHSRAARWLEAHDLPAEAIPHYLAAGEPRPAARLIHRLAGELARHGEMQTLLAWTQALPAAEVRLDPTLLAYQALARLMTGDLAGAGNLLEDTGDPGAQQGIGAVNSAAVNSGALRSILAWLRMVRGEHEGLQSLAEQALAEIDPEDAIFRVLALLVLGNCYFIETNIAASNEAFQEAYHLGLRSQHPFAALAGLENLVFNLYDLGQLRRARLLCLEAQERFTDPRGNPLPVLGMIDVPLSAIYLEQRDLDQAEAYARRGRALCQKLFSSEMEGGDAETVLARVAHLQGRREEAFQILSEMRQVAIAQGMTAIEDKMNVSEADLYLLEGDSQAARACLDRLELHPHGLIAVASFTRQVLLAEIHLFEDQPESALDLLSPLEAAFRRTGNIRRVIRLLGVKAAALHQLGRAAEALTAMEEAIALAAPEGYLNVLLRIPRQALALLTAVRPAAPEFVDLVLSLLPSVEDPAAPKELAASEDLAAKLDPNSPENRPSSHPARPQTPPSIDEPVEPLSDQEKKVLRLLAAGRSNQEIAEALFISVGTVKWHVHNILGKLGASSRSQAAARARQLGWM